MSILDDYKSEPKVKVAQPGVFDWKKRLDEKRATLAKNSVMRKLPQQDGELSRFGDLVIGEGLTQVY